MNKECFFTTNGIKHIDYKDVDLLRMFITPHGQVVSSKRSGFGQKEQRALATAVKRSRFMGLLPYIAS